MGFAGGQALIVLAWVAVNLGWLPGAPRFDRSFVGLATVASVEALFLSTFVLISQNRAAADADRRADLDLQTNLLTEHEVSRVAAMVLAIARKLEVEAADEPDLPEITRDVLSRDRHGRAGADPTRLTSRRARPQIVGFAMAGASRRLGRAAGAAARAVVRVQAALAEQEVALQLAALGGVEGVEEVGVGLAGRGRPADPPPDARGDVGHDGALALAHHRLQHVQLHLAVGVELGGGESVAGAERLGALRHVLEQPSARPPPPPRCPR